MFSSLFRVAVFYKCKLCETRVQRAYQIYFLKGCLLVDDKKDYAMRMCK